jgi:hypothetical protein
VLKRKPVSARDHALVAAITSVSARDLALVAAITFDKQQLVRNLPQHDPGPQLEGYKFGQST